MSAVGASARDLGFGERGVGPPTLTSDSAVANVSTKANSRRSSRNGPRHSARAADR